MNRIRLYYVATIAVFLAAICFTLIGCQEQRPETVTVSHFFSGGRYCVRVDLPPGWYIYSTTQKGGPRPTTILLSGVGEFRAETPPEKNFEKLFGVEVEKHRDVVLWSAPVTGGPILGFIQFQVCDGSNCRIMRFKLTRL